MISIWRIAQSSSSQDIQMDDEGIDADCKVKLLSKIELQVRMCGYKSLPKLNTS